MFQLCCGTESHFSAAAMDEALIYGSCMGKEKMEAAREIIIQDKKRHIYATTNDLKLIDLDGERVEDRSMGKGEEDLHT